MNEIGTFDILGPNMIGPSSSHTAGALRIAFIAGKMVEKPAAVRFVLYGSFARTYHGHGTDRALVGGILGYHPDDERIRDSFEHAKEAGLDFTFEENFTDKEIYPNTVDIYVKDENGNVCGVQVAKMELGEMDESGRASCHEVKDSLFTMDCDLVAMAIGQKVDFTPLNNDLKTTDTHASTLDNVFIIGDAFTGPKTIGSAVMEGKKIAKEIIGAN